jgi:3-hydroxy-9,10-secoandrosta-1,3,5(10)-triene-9,17-dione monooxygenase
VLWTEVSADLGGEIAQAQTEHNPNPVALAAELRPLLERNAVRAERDRRLPDENIAALEAANLFKVMVPRRWGGFGAPLPTPLSTFAELAKGCSSSGWVTMILGGVTYYASLLPDRGQEEIFVNPAASRVCGSGAPTSIGRRVDGGWRISGKFPFASGSLHSSWASLWVQMEDDAHNVIDQVGAFAPLSELEIEDTWFVAACAGPAPTHWSRRMCLFPFIEHCRCPNSLVVNMRHDATQVNPPITMRMHP